MNKLGLVIGSALVLAASVSAPVLAHQAASAGPVSAVLHVEPDDHVVSGVGSPFQVEFLDSAGLFKTADCDCQVAAKLNGKVVATATPKVVSDEKLSGTITFPKDGDYTLAVSAKPHPGTDFTAFKLVFPVSVSSAKSALTAKTFVVAGVIVVAVVAIAGVLIKRRTAKTGLAA